MAPSKRQRAQAQRALRRDMSFERIVGAVVAVVALLVLAGVWKIKSSSSAASEVAVAVAVAPLERLDESVRDDGLDDLFEVPDILEPPMDGEQIAMRDRAAEAVHVMPGGKAVEGALFLHIDEMAKYFYCGKAKDALCKVTQRFRQCKWCAIATKGAKGCLYGDLWANGGTMFWHHTTNIRERIQTTARAFTRLEPVNATDTLVDVMLYSCRLRKGRIPMGVRGTFTMLLPNPGTWTRTKKVVVSHDLKRTPPIVPPGSVATCGRATYGDVNANHIIQMSEYLRFHGFQSYYVYNAGSTTLHEPKALQRYLTRVAAENSTALRYLDMRNHLDALYGSSATYAFLTSHAGGQEWTKYDCALRARRDGHDWILHTDLDEYIFPGKAMIEDDLMKPMAERLKSAVRPGSEGFSFAAVVSKCDEDINPSVRWPLDPEESRARWEAYMRRSAKHYLDVVLADPLNHFSTNRGHPREAEGNACDDYHWCNGGAGTRKLFLKASFPPISLRVHDTEGGGMVWNEDADLLHTNHYKCMNNLTSPQRLMNLPPNATKPAVNFNYW